MVKAPQISMETPALQTPNHPFVVRHPGGPAIRVGPGSSSNHLAIHELSDLMLVLYIQLKGKVLMRAFLLIMLLLGNSLVFAETEPVSMDDYTTCAVYHRMMAGSFRLKGNLQLMVELETEKMDDLVKEAKLAAAEEYGEESADEYFLEEWRDVLAYMTDQINRNYENVSVLKIRYKKRCDRIGATLGSGSVKN